MKNNLLTNNIEDLADFLIEKVFNNLNCVKIGKIIKFYPENKTADVEIINKIKVNEEIKSIALLLKCLVVGNKITLPIEEGEQVVILFNDYDLNAYFETGQAQLPYSERKHDLSDGIVICGLNSLINAINYDNSAICLNYTQTKINGSLSILGTTTSKDNITSQGTITGQQLIANNGASGSFISADQKMITVENGIITGIN